MQITQINREYEFRMQALRNKHFIGWYQKKRIINNPEAQQDEE